MLLVVCTIILGKFGLGRQIRIRFAPKLPQAQMHPSYATQDQSCVARAPFLPPSPPVRLIGGPNSTVLAAIALGNTHAPTRVALGPDFRGVDECTSAQVGVHECAH